MGKRGDFSSGPSADNPFAAALASALESKGIEVPMPSAVGSAPPEAEETPISKGTLELRFERRNGRPTTVVFTDQVAHADPFLWASELKKHCSVGGSADASSMYLQGDVRAKVEAWAKDKGLKTKRIGG